MAKSEEVAQWMLDEVTKGGELYQSDVATQITFKFGNEFTYLNDNGVLCISRDVLKAFRKLSENTVVWERGYRAWRLRREGDPPGRRQADC